MGRDLDEVVDIRSGLAYLLIKWKVVVLAALVGAVLGGAFGMMKGSGAQTEAASGYEDTISKARAACSEAGALYVEQLSAQYKAYNRELSRWGVYLNNSVLQNMDPYNYVKKDLQYKVVSDSGNTAAAFSKSLLGQKECETIAGILGVDPLTASVEEIVAAGGSSRVSGTDVESGEIDIYTDITNNTGSEQGEIMTISIAAQDESQADSIAAVVDSAVEAKSKRIQASGTQLQVEKVDELTTRNDAGWLLNRQQQVLDRLVNFQINYSLFIKNTTDILQGAQKTYYGLLISTDPEKAAAAGSLKKSSPRAAVKYAAASGAAGLVLAVIFVYLLFVFSSKIMTGEELRNNYALSVLQQFRTGETKKWDVIKNYGLSVMGMDRAAQISAAGAAPLKTELEKRTAQMEKKQVYLTCDTADEKIRGSVKALAGILSGEGVTVIAGDPRDSEEEYRELLGSDLVVMAEVLSGSRKKSFGDLLEICRRNELPVLGCVTLLDPAQY